MRRFTHAGAQAADLNSSIRVLVAIVRLCFESNDWTALNENIVLLMKKRGQMKQVRRAAAVQAQTTPADGT